MQRFMALLSVLFILLCSNQSRAQAQWLEKTDLAQYENSVVYLNFWASWCGPCRKSFPWLNKMQAKYQKKGLVIIGINLDRDLKNTHNFLSLFPADFPLYNDPQGLLASKYKVAGLPSSYLFSGDGELAGTYLGFKKSDQKIEEATIVKLLEQLPQQKTRISR